jgi:hypothetical protein
MGWKKDIRKVSGLTSVIAHLEDGTTRDIPLKASKKKWAALESILDNLEWEWIEGQNENSECIFSFSKEEADLEISESDFDLPRFRVEQNRDAQLLELLTAGQRMVLSEMRESQSVLISSYRDLADVLIDRVGHLEERHAQMIEVIDDTVKSQVAQENSNMLENMVGKLIENINPNMVQGLLSSLNKEGEK